jgi:hypothetical protein
MGEGVMFYAKGKKSKFKNNELPVVDLLATETKYFLRLGSPF